MAPALANPQPSPPSARAFRQGLVLAAIFGVCGLAVGATGAIGEPSLGAAQLAGGGFLLAALITAARDWRAGLGMLVVIVLAEDSLRKALPGAPYAVSLGKDLLVAACYVSFFFNARQRRAVGAASGLERAGVYLPLLIWAAFVVMQAFNPHVPHWLVGFSGIRTWLVFTPLIVLLANTFRESDSADRVLRWIAYLAIPLVAVALLQNLYYDELPGFLADSAFAKFRSLESGEFVRYNESIFASPTLYALACVYQLCLVVGLLKVHRPPKQRVLLWISGYCTVMGAHLSGVRTGLLFAGVAVLALLPLLLFPRERREDGVSRRRPGLVIGGVVGLMLGAVLVGSMKETRAEAFWSSLEVSIIGERIEESVVATARREVPPLGFGTGSGGKSGQVMVLFGMPQMGNEHLEWGNLLVRYSYGPVGFWFGAFVLAWFMAGMLAVAVRNRQGRFASLRYALWIYLGAQMGWFLFKAYPVMENGTMVMMFWTTAGVILGLARLDERELAGGNAPLELQ